MKSKRLLSLLTAATLAASSFAAIITTASAASLDDAKTITADLTYWFDDANGNGTTKIEGNTVFGEYFFTPYGNNAAANKGKTTVDGVEHLNSLRVKSATQDRFAFKVGAAATITFYTQSHNSRGVVITAEDYTTAKESQTAGTTEFEYSVDSAQTIYVTAFGGDFFIAGVSVDITGDAPAEPTTAPAEPTTAPAEPTTAPAVRKDMPIDTTIVFDDYVGSIADGAVVADYILVNDKNAKVAVDKNNKTVDEVAYTTRIKSGGNTAVYTITPEADGTLQVLALSANASNDRAFAVNGEEAIAPASASGVVPAWFSFDVKAGNDVTITFPGGGVNFYCIKLIKTPVVITPSLEKAEAYTDGTDSAVVGKVNINITGGAYTFDSKKITYEGRNPVATDLNDEPIADGTVISATDVLVYVVINGTTDTEALKHVIFE